jgi:flagellar FliJ protein
MNNRTQFDLLEELANTRGDAIARRLRTLLTRQRDAQAKRELLGNYHSDYCRQLDESIRSGITGESLHNFETFLRSLETALAQQTLELQECAKEIERVKAEWQREKLRAESFATLSERVMRERLRSDAREQQKQQDEFSARIVQYKITGAD